MKYLRVIYFHVYNAYYKDGRFSSDVPHLKAFGLVGCSFCFMIAVICALTFQVLNGVRFSFGIGLFIEVLSSILFYYLLLFNRVYEKINQEFKGSKFDCSSYKILSWLVVIIGFAAVGLYGYFFNRPVK